MIIGLRNFRVAVIAFVITACLLFAPQLSLAQALALAGPLRMANSPFGLLVADYVGGKIVIVDRASMEATSTFPVYSNAQLLDINGDPVVDANGDPVFRHGKPLSVGWMNGRLYVGEERSGLIQVFENTGGKKLKNKKPKDIKPKKKPGKSAVWVKVAASLTDFPVPQPSAIAVDELRGWLFVSSKSNGAVYVIDEAGTLIKTIGDAQSAAPLGRPQAIALDTLGARVFVSDDGIESRSGMGRSLSSAVQIYDYDGLSLGIIDGRTGNAGYHFSRAQGVALDSDGRFYLADSYRHDVMVFGELSPNKFGALAVLGGKGSGPGQLLLPTGVLSDPDAARILVANTMLNRIEVLATGSTGQ